MMKTISYDKAEEMDQSEENEVEPERELGSPSSSDKENSSSAESQKISKDPPKTQNLDLNDYDTMEELDFEDERRDSDLQKYVNVLQTSVQQNIICDSQNGTSPRRNGGISLENNELLGTNLENSNTGEKNCSASDIEEGEAVDDDDGECADIEDGEIDIVSKSEDLQKYSCRFYQRGRCIWGKECRYFHLSDKGLYNMFDSPVARKKPPVQNISFVVDPNYVCQLPPPLPIKLEDSPESVWDRALHEAKQRIKQSKIRKVGGFEGKVHLKIENNDRLMGKSKTPVYSRDRPISPVPLPERVVCAFSNQYDSKKSERSKHAGVATKPNLAKNTSGRKIGCDSEWRDPWRRSKTPPKHKRFPSKSFSDSSKSSVSSCKSRSSWESASRVSRSPSPKRCKRYRSSSRHNRSCSYDRKVSPVRSIHRKSSGSYRGSTSSCSGSSSPDFSSSRIYKRGSPKKSRSPSSSPVYHKRKNRYSHDSIVLPYKKPSKSVSPTTVQRRIFQKVFPVKRIHTDVLSKRSLLYRSKSKSPSSSKSLKRRHSKASSCSRSSSDASISSASGSSLSRKSNYSDEDLNYKHGRQDTESSKIRKIKLVPKSNSSQSGVVGSLSGTFSVSSRDKSLKSTFAPSVADSKIGTFSAPNRDKSLKSTFATSVSDSKISTSSAPNREKSFKSTFAPSVSDLKIGTFSAPNRDKSLKSTFSPVSDSKIAISSAPNRDKSLRSMFAPSVSDSNIQTKKPKNTKQIQALEMELLKYQGNFKKPSVEKEPKTTQLCQNVTIAANFKRPAMNVNLENRSKSTLNAREVQIDRKPSKRDLLMLQLKAVEEAIARKKKFICST